MPATTAAYRNFTLAVAVVAVHGRECLREAAASGPRSEDEAAAIGGATPEEGSADEAEAAAARDDDVARAEGAAAAREDDVARAEGAAAAWEDDVARPEDAAAAREDDVARGEGAATELSYPVDAVFSRRHISFGLGGGPIVFGSLIDDGHYVGSHIGGVVNLGLGHHVDLRGGVHAGPSASTRGLFLPLGVDVELRFGHTARPFSAGIALGLGYLFVPELPSGASLGPIDGFFLRPQIVPAALQLSRFEVELAVGLDLVMQRVDDENRFGPGFVSTTIRFYFVGYEEQDVLRR